MNKINVNAASEMSSGYNALFNAVIAQALVDYKREYIASLMNGVPSGEMTVIKKFFLDEDSYFRFSGLNGGYLLNLTELEARKEVRAYGGNFEYASGDVSATVA